MMRKRITVEDLEDRPMYFGQVVMVSTRGYGFLWCEFLKSKVYFRTNVQAELFFRSRDETIRFSGTRRLSVFDPKPEDVLVFRAIRDPSHNNFRVTSWVYGQEYIEAQDELENLTQFRVVSIKRFKDDLSQDKTKIIWEGRTLESFRCKFPVYNGQDSYVSSRMYEHGRVRFEMRLEALYFGKWVVFIHSQPENVLPSFVIAAARSFKRARQ